MRSCKAAVCAALALCLFIFSCAPAFAAERFSDVHEADWFYSPVEGAAAAGIIGGYPDGTFKPGQNVSKQESLIMIYQTLLALGLLKTQDDLSEAYAEQVAATHAAGWASKFVSYALAHGIAEAADFTTGDATAPAERELIAKWTARALDLPDIPMRVLSYEDAAEVSSVNVQYVCAMQRFGLMTGDNTNRVHPRDGIRRCEFASICVRLLALKKTADLQTSWRLLYGTVSDFDPNDNSFTVTEAGGKSRVQIARDASIFIDGNLLGAGGLAALSGPVCLSAVCGPSFSVTCTTDMQVRSAQIKAVQSAADFTILTLQLNAGAADFIADSATISGKAYMVGNTITFIAEGGRLLEVN